MVDLRLMEAEPMSEKPFVQSGNQGNSRARVTTIFIIGAAAENTEQTFRVLDRDT